MTLGALPYRILVVDDEPAQRRLAGATLQAPKYALSEAADGWQGLAALQGTDFDCILLDRRMPGMDGQLFLRRLRSQAGEALRPVIMITGYGDGADAISEALQLGATDFLPKPYDPVELIARVDAAVERKRLTDQLEDAESILFAQARLAEARDHCTGNHIARVTHGALVFGQSLGLPADELAHLRRGAVLHDIGKLGIPDAILLKPSRLTPDEFQIMQRHTAIGARLVSGMRRMNQAAEIILHHHERWDGSGYPHGLSGDAIPLLARVFQLVDIYDALRFERPYKEAMALDAVVEEIRREAAAGWRAPLLAREFLAFLRRRPDDLQPDPAQAEDLGLAIFQDIARSGTLAWTETGKGGA
ncbi:MAG: response regulator [Betaproteobacteria bacterium]|nr:response regulator [Betaproteobacteria bacterium]